MGFVAIACGQQRQLSDLAKLTWQQFEEVIGDAYRLSHKVAKVGGRGTADGGVDLILERDGTRIVVQAKHWRRDVAGVSLVRELYGVQQATGADGAIFVTMGRFSSDAIAFAGQVGMTLVDGPELLRIISAGLAGKSFEVPLAADTTVPTCPVCGADVVHRTARRAPTPARRSGGAPSFRPAGRRARSTPSPSAPTDRTPRVGGHRVAASAAAATRPSVGCLAPVACLRVHRRDRVRDL